MAVITSPVVGMRPYTYPDPLLISPVKRLVPSGLEGRVIILDSFSGAGALGGTSPDTIDAPGNTWVEQLGTWQRSGGAAIITVPGPSFATIDGGVFDFRVTLSMNVDGPAVGQRGAVIRFVDGNNYWRVGIFDSGAKFIIKEKTAGVVTIRAEAAIVPALGSGVPAVIALAANGQKIQAVLNGTIAVSYGSALAHINSTLIGLDSRTTVDAHTEFKVETI